MIEILTTVATSICLHCGGAIRLLKGDLRGLGNWVHDPPDSPGEYIRWCPGAPLAEPSDEAP